MGLTPTDEQRFALDQFLSGDNLKIEAGAGAGKSTTLRLLAEKGDPGRGLYVAFNKSVQDAAKRLFHGTEIEPRTAHSLAYRAFGAPLQHRLKAPFARWGEQIADLGVDSHYFPLDAGATVQRVDQMSMLRAATSTMSAFCHSAEFEVGTEHVAIPKGVWARDDALEDFRRHVVPIAQRMWEQAQDPNAAGRISHDVYLKLFQLSEPNLGVDTVFLDEAQDADGVMLAIIKAQTESQLVAVGDRNQAIYGWRGAVNAMDDFADARTARLSQSFRFGPQIAEEANHFLDLLESDMRMTGSGNPDSRVGSYPAADAVLVRSNGGAVAELMAAHDLGLRVALAGESRARELRGLAQAAVELSEHRRTHHADFALFKSWREVVDFSDTDEGSSLAPFVKVVEEHGARAIVDAIDRCVEPARAQLTIATAHVAKGLEWGTVRISNDFRGLTEDADSGEMILPSDEELRLAYVAVTRAKDGLDLGGLDWAREALGYELAPA